MSFFKPLTESEVRELIESEDVNMRNDIGHTPLHYQTDEVVVRLLIEAGADVDVKNKLDNTPLHYIKNESIVRLFIETGANVNVRNHWGDTPLHRQEEEGVLRLLINAGADVNVRNDDNETPLEYNPILRYVVEDMASEKITRFVRNCKWLRLHKLTKTFAFNKWYCGEEDGKGGGTGRKVDHKRIMDTNFVR